MKYPIYKKFTSLTDKEIKQIVEDLFHPKKISNIERDEGCDSITLDMTTDWGDDGSILITDTITLSNPFENALDSICIAGYEWDVTNEEIHQLKQFCFAKGLFPEDWYTDNPYIEKKKAKKQTIINHNSINVNGGFNNAGGVIINNGSQADDSVHWKDKGSGREESSDGRFIIERREDPVNGKHFVLIDTAGTAGDNEYHHENKVKCKMVADSILAKEKAAKGHINVTHVRI